MNGLNFDPGPGGRPADRRVAKTPNLAHLLRLRGVTTATVKKLVVPSNGNRAEH
jgi:hypothetical protein